MSHLSKQLAELRKKQGYTQFDVSYLLNIARTTYANWEYVKADRDAHSIMHITSLMGRGYLILFSLMAMLPYPLRN